MAKINLKQNRYSAAMKIVDNAIKLDNSCAEAYKYKSMIFAAQGLKQRSIDCARTAVSLKPDDAEYYAFLAKLLFDAMEYEDAFLYYKEAASIDNMNLDYLHFAAQSADKANDFANAANYYSYSLRLDPANNLIIYEYVDLLTRNNKIKQALSFLKSKIDTIESENVVKVLKQKYDELDKELNKPLFSKFKDMFNK